MTEIVLHSLLHRKKLVLNSLLHHKKMHALASQMQMCLQESPKPTYEHDLPESDSEARRRGENKANSERGVSINYPSSMNTI